MHWPSFRERSHIGRESTSHGRIRHGGNDDRGGGRDHRGDGQRAAEIRLLLLTAWRGVPADAVGLIEAAAAEGNTRGEGRLLGLAGYATAVLFNGLGRYEEAFAAAREACEYEDLGFYSWCLIELIEAAVHMGERARPRRPSAARGTAGASGTDWGLGALAARERCWPTTNRREPLHRSDRTSGARQHRRAFGARSSALRGVAAAAESPPRCAPTPHRSPCDVHPDGRRAFAERARRELVATGEKVRKQPVSSGDELTAQEAQIARLAAEGLTNQEIGAQLFISTHTVEWHLRKVFVKLGITSRSQLRTVSWAS